jgi:hypothetical protein
MQSKLIVVDPGHFHATLPQKDMYPRVDPRVTVRIAVTEKFRAGHEAHFGQVANRFFDYVASPKSLPAWETPYMLAKYTVSTKGVERGKL